MARSDLILNLVKAGVSGDATAARATAEKIAAEERAKRHAGVADRITKILETPVRDKTNGGAHGSGVRVRDGSGGIRQSRPERSITDLYLRDDVRRACDELVEEQHRADLLRAYGLEPRHRVLLVGPPGNGKTSLAEALAFELGVPLFTVRYDAIITSYLGETAQRLRRLFDFIRTEPCVLFFDEFDAIGKERGDIHETGEIKRVVTTLLLQLDELPSHCVLVGATNHPELLDRATWRRFQLSLELPQPSEKQLQRYFSDQLRSFSNPPGYTAKRLLSLVNVRSFSEAEDFFEDVRRRDVLAQGAVTLRSIIDGRVQAWNSRKTGVSEGKADDGSTNSSPA